MTLTSEATYVACTRVGPPHEADLDLSDAVATSSSSWYAFYNIAIFVPTFAKAVVI